MPSSLHEALTDMFRHRPTLAAELLADALGMKLPGYEQATVESADFTVLTPTEYRADAVVVLSAAGSAVLAVVVEVQLHRDPGKHWSWPVYLATLRGRFRCATVLLVVCVDAATAGWCATPIELGPGATVTPMVLGTRSGTGSDRPRRRSTRPGAGGAVGHCAWSRSRPQQGVGCAAQRAHSGRSTTCQPVL